MIGNASPASAIARKPFRTRTRTPVLLLEPGRADAEDRLPLEMWSRVVAIFAVSVGSRNGLAPTIRPIRIRSVACAQAASVSHASNIGPLELPWIG
jgi:hypothetical protein